VAGHLPYKLSEVLVFTIAMPCGRARGEGSEVGLARDVRFAAQGRPYRAAGAVSAQLRKPVACNTSGDCSARGQAMEALLGAADFDAEQTERYGRSTGALPDAARRRHARPRRRLPTPSL
jgi:hypothetical protein